MVCNRCQKRPAIIFVQRMENGQMKNEGFCLHCARELHIKPVEDLMKQFGMSDEDMDNMENRMESMMDEMGDANPLSLMMNMGQPMGGEENEGDDDLVPGSSATFPLGVKAEGDAGNSKKAQKNGKKPPRRKFLDTYCENLTRKAREGKLDDIVGRDREIYRTIQILSRRQKNNPCLIGEAGVGKTAIAEGIAERIAKGQVPAGLQDKEIFLLDLTSLVAGTQFRGQFEQRVKGLLSEVKAAGNIILFIDEIHTITSAGESEGAMNAGNILKPALSRGEIQVIGATTFTEYRKYIEKDQALERRFQPVRVEEPSVADTLAVMNGIKRGLFSNEAGSGSAPCAAAAAECDDPVKMGLVQALGVLIDTIVICSCTAFVMLLAPESVTSGLQGMNLLQAAMQYHLGSFGVVFIAVTLALFSFSTFIGILYYARCNVAYLFGDSWLWQTAYKVLALVMLVVGGMQAYTVVWDLGDVGIGLMTIFNMLALYPLSGEALTALREYEAKKKLK